MMSVCKQIQLCGISLQVPCSQRAPANCLQYYTAIEGNFSSFNYYNTDGVPPQQGYMNNMDYTICIRRDAGYCSTVRTIST